LFFIGEFDDYRDPQTEPIEDDCEIQQSYIFDDDKHLNIVVV
jgi:hypothetical protein